MPENKKISRNNVAKMFDGIAPKYDFLNHLLSFGIDKRWRRKASIQVKDLDACDVIADFATGTGDFAIDLVRYAKPSRIIGLDLSEQMLAVARKKVEKRGLGGVIDLHQEDCEHTSLEDGSMDVVTVGFGIRNFRSPDDGLKEMLRVLRAGGSAVILEFSTPKKGLMAGLVKWYYFNVMPLAGKLFAGNKGAYTYLPSTIFEFPNGVDFCDMMQSAGFECIKYKSLTFNMVNLYVGKKPLCVK